MAVVGNRFECVADPCDLWMVWDRWCGVPAQERGLDFVGLTRAEVVRLCADLNGAHTSAEANKPVRCCDECPAIAVS
jgi:hypothetical protein